MTDQPTTNALDHAIRMWASMPGDQAYLLNAFEEAQRLIANLQARVDRLEQMTGTGAPLDDAMDWDADFEDDGD